MARVLAVAPLVLLTACFRVGDGDNNNNNADGGSTSDPACMMASADAGPLLVPCNPATGMGCMESSLPLSCVWNPDTDKGDCRCSSDRQEIGEGCSLGQQNCVAGAVCIFLQDDPEPVCHKVCEFQTQRGCEAFGSVNEAFACLPLQRADGSRTEEFGLCLGVGQPCDPLNDTCPANEGCTIVGRTSVCGPAGNAQVGEACGGQTRCARGGLCLLLGDAPATCYEPCMVNAQMCTNSAEVCSDVGLSFGICTP